MTAHPVIVEYAERRVLWVEAATLADAVAETARDSAGTYNATPPEGALLDMGVRAESPDQFDWRGIYDGPCEGPQWRCPSCGRGYFPSQDEMRFRHVGQHAAAVAS